MLISAEYLDLQRELHRRSDYGISSQKWADIVHDLATKFGCRTILDYGCGKGYLAATLLNRPRDYVVSEYDPAIEGRDTPPGPADLVFCGDVLEHIEPECLNAVLADLSGLTRRIAFLVIATRPASKRLADGRNAHLIVESASWWLPHLTSHWRTEGFAGTAGELQFLGSPG